MKNIRIIAATLAAAAFLPLAACSSTGTADGVEADASASTLPAAAEKHACPCGDACECTDCECVATH